MTATVTTPTDSLDTVPIDELVVDANVREDLKLDPSFVSSIRNHGIIQPPVGWRDADGRVHITAGQRRTLAAREIGMTAIQVVIKPKEHADAVRIVAQLTENDQREQLSNAEHVAAYQQLALLGVSVDQIARRTNAPRKRVETALTVAGSEIATEAIQAAPITLDQAAVLVEFEDTPEHVEHLLTTAADRPSYFDHEAQRLRQDRAYDQARAALAAKLEKAGWTLVDGYPPSSNYLDIESLWGATDPDKKKLTTTTARQYTDRVVYLYRAWGEDKPAARYYIGQWQEQGLASHEWNYGRSTAAAGPTKEEKAAKRQANADMRAATTVRRNWLRDTFIPTITLRHPHLTSVLEYVAAALADAPGHYCATEGRVWALACELLGVPFEPPKYSYETGPQHDALVAALPDVPAWRAAAAIAIARTESVIGDPKATDFATGIRGSRYLQQLQTWGYTLADVEQATIDRAAGVTVDDVIAETADGGDDQ